MISGPHDRFDPKRHRFCTNGAAMAGANIVAVDASGDLYHVDHLFCGIRKVHYTGMFRIR